MMTFSRLSQNVLHGNVCNPGLSQPVFAHRQQDLNHCQASVEDVVEVLGESPDMKSEELMEYLDKEEFNEDFSPENCFEKISSPTDSHSSFFTEDMFRSSGFGAEQRPAQDFYGTPQRQQTIDHNSTFMNFLPSGMSNQQYRQQPFFTQEGSTSCNTSSSMTSNFRPLKFEIPESAPLPFPSTLTPEELRKKLKNNHACKMSRIRRREQKIYMENRARELTDENRQLRMQIVRLEVEKQRIRQLIVNHHNLK